jgi:cyclase
MTEVAVVETGLANVASVLASLSRLGARVRRVERADEVSAAERLVLPGVGAFGPAMETLTARGLVEPLRARLLARRPTLGICLGLQLWAEASEESPGVAGLGVIPGAVRRLGPGVPVPHMGWNPASGLGHVYFANSFGLGAAPAGWSVARTRHGGVFVAALEDGPVLGCQFHPELSGALGEALLGAWLAGRPALGGAPEVEVGELAARIIPCLDVKDGRVVKGVRFQGLRDAGEPAAQAARYAAQGADELVVLDVSATDEGRRTALATVRAVRAELSIPLTVGGGVRGVDDAAALLDAGADKVSVNTAAVARPELLTELAARFGRQCTVLALDAARRADGAGHEVVVRAGKERTGQDAVAWAQEAEARGAGELLLTSWDRDGTRDGYDLELLAKVSAAVRIPVIASGGASHAGHLAEALDAGASAVLAASIFHDGELTVGALKERLAERGREVRR